MRTVRCSGRQGGVSAQGGVCPGVSARGCLPRGCLADTSCEQNDWQTPVKILPCRNYVADGNYLCVMNIFFIVLTMSPSDLTLYLGSILNWAVFPLASNNETWEINNGMIGNTNNQVFQLGAISELVELCKDCEDRTCLNRIGNKH